MLLFIFSILQIQSVHASVWDGNLTVTQEYSCFGLDGVPIGKGATIAGHCCDGDGHLIYNPPTTDDCMAGFVTIAPEAATNAGNGNNVGINTLHVAQTMGGNTNDPSSNQPNLVGTSIGAGNGGESIASVAGGNTAGGDYGSGSGNTAGGTTVGGGPRSGGGKGGSGGSGGGGLGLGSAGNTTGLKGNGGADPNNVKANGGGYSKGDGGGGSSAGGSGVGGLGGMFGGGATAGGAGVGAGGANELAFGEGANTAGGDGSGANGAGGEDGEGKGTTEDPSDYFSRIDKSANIFKIVSARYLKKKSLWVLPEKKI